MSVISLARRIERLEAVRAPFDPANMSDDELRQCMGETLRTLGGREAALAVMRAIPDFDPDTIKTVEEWPEWSQRSKSELSRWRPARRLGLG